jgi:hypothetical protein
MNNISISEQFDFIKAWNDDRSTMYLDIKDDKVPVIYNLLKNDIIDDLCTDGCVLLYYAIYYENIDRDKYDKYIELSFQQNNTYAINKIASRYIDTNPLKAKELYLQSVELGDSFAMNNLGNYYWYRHHYHEAYYWYSRSAELRNAFGMKNIAECLEKGQGVEVNKKMAFNWYCKCAATGWIGAYLYVGNCYRKGVGVKQDYVMAIEMYKKASSKKWYNNKLIEMLTEGADILADFVTNINNENEKIISENEHLRYYPGNDHMQAIKDYSLTR